MLAKLLAVKLIPLDIPQDTLGDTPLALLEDMLPLDILPQLYQLILLDKLLPTPLEPQLSTQLPLLPIRLAKL